MNTADPRNGKLHKILLTVVAIQIAIVGIVVTIRFLERDAGRHELVRLETGVPTGTALSIETGFPGALAYAREWADDAYLFAASMQIDWPSDPGKAASSEIPSTGWIIYTFGSARDETMSILVDRMSGAVFDEQHMKWSSKPDRTISDTTYPISSTTALFATETTLGAPFRQACPQFRNLSRVSFVPDSLGTTETESVEGYWLVSYEDTRAIGRPAFTVEVDAENGSVRRDDIAVDAITICET